jgi:hypothetical protein
MVKRRHKPISDSEISTLADQQRPEKVGSKRRLRQAWCTARLIARGDME